MTPEQEIQYKALIKARNFHYENLNKWLTFFYVAIGAIFAGYCKLLTECPCSSMLPLILGVGYIIGLAGYLSCKGYCYWENNWIMLLHDFERKNLYKGQRVYSVFANVEGLDKPWRIVKGANVSTTKVALVLTFIITCVFGILLWENMDMKPFNKDCCNIALSIISPVILTWLIAWLGAKMLHSNLKGLDDLKLPVD